MKRYSLIRNSVVQEPNEPERYLIETLHGDLIFFQDMEDFMDAVADLVTTKNIPESKLAPVREALNNLSKVED